MEIPLFQVDAFTDRPFAGNPAAVCLLPEPKDDQWMQAVAAEMNLSETAFLRKQDDGYRLRWFTPKIEVESEEIVRSLKPDFAQLRQISMRGVIVTSPSDDPRFDFVSRYFAPGAGIDEDPVTGSAHCCLGPYWSERLGKREMTAYQVSARGGVVRVRVIGDRIMLGGQAVTVMKGGLL